MIMRRVTSSLLGVAMLAAATGALSRPAAAQMETREGIALQNQILELQHEVQALEQQRSAGGGYGGGYAAPAPYPSDNGGSPATRDIVTRLLSRVDALEATVRDLRGQVEELSNQQQQTSAQLGKRIDDLQFQMQNPAPGTSAPPPRPAAPPPPRPAAIAAPTSPPAPAAPAVSAEVARRTPELALQNGDAALNRRDYAVAEQDAREVLANRTSPRAYDAQFLLAQALLGQHQYSQAAIAFDDAYNRSRKGSHAADSLLGLSDALIGISEKRAACDTLTKLRTEFPHPRADLRDRIAQNSRRAGCH